MQTNTDALVHALVLLWLPQAGVHYSMRGTSSTRTAITRNIRGPGRCSGGRRVTSREQSTLNLVFGQSQQSVMETVNTSNDWSENTKSFRGVHLPVAHLMQVWTKCFTPVNKTQADDTQNLHQLVYKSKCGDTLQLFTWKHVHGSAKVLFLVFKTQWNKCITWHHRCFNWSQLQSGKGEGLISTVCGDHSTA